MKDRKTLVFCINIDHSKQINELLRKSNISSMHIDGKMSIAQRHSILSSFRNNEISVLCNCQLLTEGFDEPSIDGIILARPTKSRSLFLQMIGRGLRIHPGKANCKIIDIVDNHKNLAGFNHLIDDVFFPHIESFKSINDISKHISKEELKVTEFRIERADLFNHRSIDKENALDCMLKYLEENKIQYFEPLSFDEASFLIWYNELKKEFYNGLSGKKTA